VLVYNVLATNEILAGQRPLAPSPGEHPVIHQLWETYAGVSRKNFQEAYHDALQIKEEAITAFNLGVLDLKARARVEEMLQRVKRLSPRETEVFALVVTGMLNKQIAAAIGVNTGTVKVHRARVMDKMHAASLAELVRLADAVGVIVPKT
jgi:DNA-binding NarL/FixJ family response regulator